MLKTIEKGWILLRQRESRSKDNLQKLNENNASLIKKKKVFNADN